MSGLLPFTKMHGAGNDYVVLDNIRDDLPKDLPKLARDLSDRHFGVGFDQMLVVRQSDAAEFRMDIYNADGSQAEMCANGIRAFYLYVRDMNHTRADEIGVETLGGIVRPRWAGPGQVAVDMGLPILIPEKIPTTLATGLGPVLEVPIDLPNDLWPDRPKDLRASSVSIGNPHCVIQVDDIDAIPLDRVGPALEHHVAFPNRVNVEFIEVVSRSRIRQRTWERGTGETLACGSGACAVAVTTMLRDVVEREITIELRGGELELAWADKNSSIWMTGPAKFVFTGEWPLDED
ncbi:MAG TPA: diaminopimelate epimerase [Myxococcales bacterium]|nr:diaminopimelate epimerase [Myxococcales bacterium]HIK85024.1 diaminopimelate epimerase [Myxococcales bacterium]